MIHFVIPSFFTDDVAALESVAAGLGDLHVGKDSTEVVSPCRPSVETPGQRKQVLSGFGFF